MLRMSRAIVPLIMVFVSGCANGDSSPIPTAPSPSPTSQVVQQPGLSGYVGDTAFRSVAGARVEMVDGPQPGMAVLSGSNGVFSFSGTFPGVVTMRASKDGYIALSKQSQTSTPGGRPWATFQLEVLAPPVNVAGDYTLTFVADSACAEVPNELRTRNYHATVTPEQNALARPGTFYTLTTLGATFVKGYDNFPIGVAGEDVAFMVYQSETFGLVEEIAPGAFLGFSGQARLVSGSPLASTISMALDGAVDYCALQPGSVWSEGCNSGPRIAHARCESTNHRLMLTRR